MSPHLRVEKGMKCQKGGGGLGIYFFLRISLSILENWALNALYHHSNSATSKQDELVSHNSMLTVPLSWHNWHLDLEYTRFGSMPTLFVPTLIPRNIGPVSGALVFLVPLYTLLCICFYIQSILLCSECYRSSP